MDNRTLVRLAAAVLGLLAVGLLLTGTIIAVHDVVSCGTSDNPCDGTDNALDAAQSVYFAVKTLAFGAGLTLAAASLMLLGYLRQTSGRPAR